MKRKGSTPHLFVVCGVPGSGKSTLASHLMTRWGAAAFASETFAAELGAAARSTSGDLTKEAIAHAYAAMERAAGGALKQKDLVVAVGSFRSVEQRRRFREVAKLAGAEVTVLRVATAVEMAAERVRLRLATGERGPDPITIQQIDDQIKGSSDIDVVLANEASIEEFHQRIDMLVQSALQSVSRAA